jgi:hypothetical protein
MKLLKSYFRENNVSANNLSLADHVSASNSPLTRRLPVALNCVCTCTDRSVLVEREKQHECRLWPRLFSVVNCQLHERMREQHKLHWLRLGSGDQTIMLVVRTVDLLLAHWNPV